MRQGTFVIHLMLCLVYTASIAYLLNFSMQSDWMSILIPWIMAFTAFAILLRQQANGISGWAFVVSIALTKLVAVFALPHLSNDFYRFWWDGWLSVHGINPYLFVPNEIPEKFHDHAWADLLQQRLPLLNSPSYHTVYPPFSQLLFAISARISGDHLGIFSVVLKLLYLVGDGIAYIVLRKLLQRMNYPTVAALFYFGNPLVTVELIGNVHTELFMVVFLISGVYFFSINAGCRLLPFLAASILSKLTVCIWIPLFTNKRNSIPYLISLALGILLSLALVVLPVAQKTAGFFSSIALYFQQFEFNSLIYAPLRNWLFDHRWYVLKNQVGWWLLGLYFIIYGLLFLTHFFRPKGSGFPFHMAWWIGFLYFMLSSTIHPWYIAPLLFFGIFYLPITSLVWSALISISYHRYDPTFSDYQIECLIVEYGLLLCTMVMEKTGILEWKWKLPDHFDQTNAVQKGSPS